MEGKEFKIGDVVQLNSGSKAMTISNIIDEFVFCWWHSADGVLMKEKFNKDMIRFNQDAQSEFVLDLTEKYIMSHQPTIVLTEKKEK